MRGWLWCFVFEWCESSCTSAKILAVFGLVVCFALFASHMCDLRTRFASLDVIETANMKKYGCSSLEPRLSFGATLFPPHVLAELASPMSIVVWRGALVGAGTVGGGGGGEVVLGGQRLR